MQKKATYRSQIRRPTENLKLKETETGVVYEY